MKAWEAGASSEDADRYNKLYLYDNVQVTQKKSLYYCNKLSLISSQILLNFLGQPWKKGVGGNKCRNFRVLCCLSLLEHINLSLC